MNPSDTELLNVDDKTKGQDALAKEVMDRCIRIVANVNKTNHPRLDRIQLYRDLYTGKVKKKFRQPFNSGAPRVRGATHAAIHAVQHGEKPEAYYGATTLFMQIIRDFAVNTGLE